jgi:tRNA(adenine34) deaminase
MIDFDHAMGLALEQASQAGTAGEIPIGAVVLDETGAVVAAAGNARETLNDPTAHAEVLALRQAAATRGSWRLDGCSLVVTLEPCPMCAGAIVMARIATVVFGAWNDEYGAAGSRWDLVRDRRLNHRAEVRTGVREAECSAILREFMDEHRRDG